MAIDKIITHSRGSIWFCKIEFKASNMKGVQYGTRPVVVISSDDGNATNPSVVVALITSKDKAGKSINVPFINEKGEENIVLCNQLHTVNKEWLYNYCGNMPEALMNKIDDALSTSLQISRQEVDISCIKEIVNKIIESKKQLSESSKENITQEAVYDIAQQLEILFTDILVPLDRETKIKEASPILNSFVNNKEEKQSRAEEKTEDKDSSIEKVKVEQWKNKVIQKKEDKITEETFKKKNPRGFWTEQRKRQFIEHRNTLPLSELTSMYNLASSKTACQMYYTFKRELGIK